MKNIRIPPSLFAPQPGRGESVNHPEGRGYGYFRDGWHRFLGSPSARISLSVIALIALFSLLVPLFSAKPQNLMDPYYAKLPPRISSLEHRGGILEGTVKRRLGEEGLTRLYGIGIGAGSERYSPVLSVRGSEGGVRSVRIDAYLEVGFIYKTVTASELERMRAWERESGEQLLYPLVWKNEYNSSPEDANLWYKVGEDGLPISTEGGEVRGIELGPDMPLEDNYIRDDNGEPRLTLPAGSDGTSAQTRLLYYNYYLYKNGSEPNYLLGTDSQGYDLAERTAGGIRVSLILALAVSFINLCLGALVGAAEGYYGGALDIAVERVTDILSGVPFIVVATLFQIYLSDKVGAIPSLLFAFVLTGWLGTANRVRGQFFRYKNSEYVLAARTMGVSDRRIMWRHIFPNTLGTLITASALAVPGVIFTESMLSFLGIVNLGAEGVTSLGTLLSDASGVWVNYPHLMLAPATVISLLMISFNMIGNGLRDAFDPAARGGAGLGNT